MQREATRAVAASQPLAGAWLRMLPSCPEKRIRSDKYRWGLQRRMGLHVTGAPAEEATMRRSAGDPVDHLGDWVLARADRKVPHDSALRVWHDMAQASATSAVVMGDKTKAEDYEWANAGHTLDLGEPRQGKGGSDRVIELKAYNDLVPAGSSAPGACSYRGGTHPFGNTEERLIWANRGVRARVGHQKWSNATGGGQVDAKRGEYYDAIYVKRHEFWLVVMNLFGGINVARLASCSNCTRIVPSVLIARNMLPVIMLRVRSPRTGPSCCLLPS